LDETLESTFERLRDIFGVSLPVTRKNLKKLQNRQIDLGGMEDEVFNIISPKMLNYNNSWEKIREMLEEALSPGFRNRMMELAFRMPGNLKLRNGETKYLFKKRWLL